MCGIAGTFSSRAEAVESRLLEAMAGVMRERGPDDQGVWSADGIGLAHTRLSIIDVAGGAQPMWSPDRRFVIVFNGEIFNYIELRDRFLREGYPFQSRSDTEVILAAYERFGPACVELFNGQWAFALWDTRERRLFLSRDRVGVRPLYYVAGPRRFTFASTIKAIFQDPAIAREIDPRGLAQVFQFWHPVAPRTVFRNVRELEPGCSLMVTGSGVEHLRHWEPDWSAYRSESRSVSEDEWAAMLLERLSDAVRLRLRSDVPVGCYLSGGIDSTATAALAASLSPSRLKTFSIAFDDAEFDESPLQREAAHALGTEHHELHCTAGDIAALFPEAVWHAEMPLFRTAPVPMMLLSGLARREGCKVVITGEGADEVLGGYDIFKEAKIREWCAAQPGSAWRPLLLKRLYPYLPQLQRQSGEYLRAFFRATPEEVREPFFSHRTRWNAGTRNLLFLTREMRRELSTDEDRAAMAALLPGGFAAWDCFSRAQSIEFRGLLPGYILSAQGDRAAMANSVEARHPFLDIEVIRLASRIPPKLRMKGLNEKYLLKKIARNRVPESIRGRTKQPYRAPGSECFLGAAGEYVHELLSERRLRDDGVFQPQAVRALLSKCVSGREMGHQDSIAFTAVLSTELLIDRFIRASTDSFIRGSGTWGKRWTKSNAEFAIS